MSPSLRENRKAQTSTAIVTAALQLFGERGFDQVTVAEVAAAAKVGERTLYRYFADKQDLLFVEDNAFRAALRAAVERQPADAAPLAMLRGAATAVAHALEHRREQVRRRSKVIASAPALAARERAKQVASEAILAEGLCARGVPTGQARLLARITIACFDEAMTRWLAPDQTRPTTLTSELAAVFAELNTHTT